MFGQFIIGPPGSGKTTYVNGMSQFLNAIGRKTAIINLDPANEFIPYESNVNIMDLIELNEVMEVFNLGPNGGLLYCMEYILKNIDWLDEKLEELKDCYLLFDCPGQVELYTNHQAMKGIVDHYLKKNFRMVAIHLIDSLYCHEASTYIGAVLISLCTMVHLELPHINVLSKIDIIEKGGKLPFSLELYTEVMNLDEVIYSIENDPRTNHLTKLTEALCEVIDDYSLVRFGTLNIEDKESVYTLLKSIDKANGYVYGPKEGANAGIFTVADGEVDWGYEKSVGVLDKYTNE